MTDREIFEKETGIEIGKHIKFYEGKIKGTALLLVEYIEWLEKRSEWMSVEDRLPTERCLVYTDTDDKTMEYRIIPKGLIKTANDATHWRPLPTPPDEAKRGRG